MPQNMFFFFLIPTVFSEFHFILKLVFFVVSRELPVALRFHSAFLITSETQRQTGRGRRRWEEGSRDAEGKREVGGVPSYLMRFFYFTLTVTIYISCPKGLSESVPPNPQNWGKGWNGCGKKISNIFYINIFCFTTNTISLCINMSRDFCSLRVGNKYTSVTGLSQSVMEAEIPFYYIRE